MLKAIGAFAFGSVLVLCACSSHKTLTRDDLRSDITSAKSLAAETSLFLDYVCQHRATEHYAQAHIEYLAQEIDQSRQELQKSSPAQGDEHVLQILKTQFDALSAELHNIRQKLGDETALATAKQHVERIQRALDKANSSL